MEILLAKLTSFYKIISAKQTSRPITDNQYLGGSGAYSNYTWYQTLTRGSTSRMTSYREYDVMDNDVDISNALDTIAEEISGNSFKSDECLLIDVISEDDISSQSNEILTAKAALRKWVRVQNLENRIYDIARSMIKYGDVFFKRSKSVGDKWQIIHQNRIKGAVPRMDDIHVIQSWMVEPDNVMNPQDGLSGSDAGELEEISDDDIIRFTLNNDLSQTAPFGESLLRPIYRSYKQKEMLEDAIIIYRIQRAPERRVFYIDTGNIPPHRASRVLENYKNEMRQKKIPNNQGGISTQVDTTYNPQSMSEDFFFSVGPDGRGSKVETLPGGQGLGELSDLLFFQKKVWRGLKVPPSFMTDQSDGGQVFNDGKTGVAYIQELRFSLFISRIQCLIEATLDREFKRYLRDVNIFIDENIYRVRLPEPSNFGKYRQYELDNTLLSSYGSADGIAYLSKRFIMKKYLMMTDDEIVLNEMMKREEVNLAKDGGPTDFPTIYGGQDSSSPAGGFGGGMPDDFSSSTGALGGGDGGMTADMGSDLGDSEPESGTESSPETGEGSEPETPTPNPDQKSAT